MTNGCTHPRMTTGRDLGPHPIHDCMCPDCKQGFTAAEVAAQSWRKMQALILAANRSGGHTHGVFCHIFGCER